MAHPLPLIASAGDAGGAMAGASAVSDAGLLAVPLLLVAAPVVDLLFGNVASSVDGSSFPASAGGVSGTSAMRAA